MPSPPRRAAVPASGAVGDPLALKDIFAAGRDPFVLNFIDGLGGTGLPSAIVSLVLLFADVEVRRQTSRNKKPPLYPHPSFGGK